MSHANAERLLREAAVSDPALKRVKSMMTGLLHPRRYRGYGGVGCLMVIYLESTCGDMNANI